MSDDPTSADDMAEEWGKVADEMADASDGSNPSIPDLSAMQDMVSVPDNISEVILSTDGGISVEECVERYGVSEPTAHVIRGCTKMAKPLLGKAIESGEKPAIVDVGIGIAKTLLGGGDGDGS